MKCVWWSKVRLVCAPQKPALGRTSRFLNNFIQELLALSIATGILTWNDTIKHEFVPENTSTNMCNLLCCRIVVSPPV
jgi:hypothetical protein